MDKKEYIVSYINKKLTEFNDLGHVYSDEKINTLAERLASSNKTLEEVCTTIDTKFFNQLKKITHKNHLEELKKYYKSSIDKLKKGNNCYLLSYSQGVKVLEQALVTEKKKGKVTINDNKEGVKKENFSNNDYEILTSELAYLLNISYPITYRMFDEKMNPQGVITESSLTEKDRFLDLEETLQFVKEESSSFTAKQVLIDYHDKKKKRKLGDIPSKKEYKVNIEYVLNLFKLLPDITMKNYEELKSAYLNRKIFELFTNNLENTLTSVGVVIHKGKKYTYTLASTEQERITFKKDLPENKTICNFYKVEKKELLHTIIVNYYEDIKELVTLIVDNKDTLIPLIEQILKEHLEYEEYERYKKQLKENLDMICAEIKYKKAVSPDTEEDLSIYKINNDNYMVKIEPFFENYKKEEDDEKGSAALVTIIGVVLGITILLILATIYAISKVEM